jgi:hypothetical protein
MRHQTRTKEQEKKSNLFRKDRITSVKKHSNVDILLEESNSYGCDIVLRVLLYSTKEDTFKCIIFSRNSRIRFT